MTVQFKYSRSYVKKQPPPPIVPLMPMTIPISELIAYKKKKKEE